MNGSDSMRARQWLVSAVAALAVACGGGGETGTGLRVTTTWRDLPVDQLGYTLMADGTALHPTERRPAAASAPLTSGVDVVILLPDQLAGGDVRCVVEGYAGGRGMRTGASTVTLAPGRTVSVAVAPGAGPGRDGGVDPDSAPAADAASDGGRDNGRRCTSADGCASGHCVEGVCCDTSCTDACHSCAVTGRLGTCSPLGAGTRDGRCPTGPAGSCG